MQKCIAIGISFLIIFQSFHITLNDLTRIDDLITHARLHNDQFGDSFSTFLLKHYGELKSSHQNEHQGTNDDHNNLPFQHHLNHAVTTMAILLIPEFNFPFPEKPLFPQDTFIRHLHDYLLISESFQPPRTA